MTHHKAVSFKMRNVFFTANPKSKFKLIVISLLFTPKSYITKRVFASGRGEVICKNKLKTEGIHYGKKTFSPRRRIIS